jgi:hypothetical protein
MKLTTWGFLGVSVLIAAIGCEGASLMSSDRVEASAAVDPALQFRALLDTDDPVCMGAYATLLAAYPGLSVDAGASAPGDSSATVSDASLPQQTLENHVKSCLDAISQMQYDASTFSCRHFSQWVKTCLGDRSLNLQATLAAFGCKYCKKPHDAHMVTIIKTPDLGYCPLEGQFGYPDGFAKQCCRPTVAEAEACAANEFCRGVWPNQPEPRPDYEGCQPVTWSAAPSELWANCLGVSTDPETTKLVCHLIDGGTLPLPSESP